jgi:hypothetical protein
MKANILYRAPGHPPSQTPLDCSITPTSDVFDSMADRLLPKTLPDPPPVTSTSSTAQANSCLLPSSSPTSPCLLLSSSPTSPCTPNSLKGWRRRGQGHHTCPLLGPSGPRHRLLLRLNGDNTTAHTCAIPSRPSHSSLACIFIAALVLLGTVPLQASAQTAPTVISVANGADLLRALGHNGSTHTGDMDIVITQHIDLRRTINLDSYPYLLPLGPGNYTIRGNCSGQLPDWFQDCCGSESVCGSRGLKGNWPTPHNKECALVTNQSLFASQTNTSKVWFDNVLIRAAQSKAEAAEGTDKSEEYLLLLDFRAPGSRLYLTNTTLSGGCGFSNGINFFDGRFFAAGVTCFS